jgi:hypothetical protein
VALQPHTMDTKNKRIAIGVATSLGLAAAFLACFLWFRSELPGRDSVLSWMPATAETVLFIDLEDLRHAPFFADLIAWAPKPSVDENYSQFRRDTGFDYEKDLDRVGVAFERHGTQQTFFAVASGRFDRQKIKNYAAKLGTVRTQNGLEIFSVPAAGPTEPVSFTFLRKDLIAFTNAADLIVYLKPKKTPETADWHTRFERVSGSPIFVVLRHDAIAAAIGSQLGSQNPAQRAIGGYTSPQLSSLLAQLQWLSIAAKSLNDRLRVVADGESNEDGNTRQLTDLLNGMALLARAGLGNARTQQHMDAGTRNSYVEVLKSVDVSRIDRGDTKSVRLMFEVTPQVLNSAPFPIPAAPASK